MSLLGQTRQDLPFTVCDKFQPVLLEGQICYSLNVSLVDAEKPKAGPEYGLVFLLDSGTVKHNGHPSQMTPPLTFESQMVDKNAARIYLNTLTSFSDFRAGRYVMTGLKKITGTSEFLALEDQDRKCQIEPMEECLSKAFIEEVKKECGCVPWALSSVVKVNILY